MAIAQNYNYNYDQRQFLNASLVWSSQTPEICYGTKPEWTIALYQDDAEATEGVSPMNLTGVASWAAAVDVDKDVSTVPMCRSVADAVQTIDAEHGVVSVRLDAETETFLAAVNGESYGVDAYFELWGYDSDGAAVFHLVWSILATMCVDAGTSENPPEPEELYYTKAQVNALFGEFESVVESGTLDAAVLTGTIPESVSIDAARIQSGVMDKARLPELASEDVPSLDASKIASGVFDKERLPEITEEDLPALSLTAEDIPSLDASKIASGVFDKARLPELAAEDIPSLDASKIVSGVFDAGRIPSLDANKIASGFLSMDRIYPGSITADKLASSSSSFASSKSLFYSGSIGEGTVRANNGDVLYGEVDASSSNLPLYVPREQAQALAEQGNYCAYEIWVKKAADAALTFGISDFGSNHLVALHWQGGDAPDFTGKELVGIRVRCMTGETYVGGGVNGAEAYLAIAYSY